MRQSSSRVELKQAEVPTTGRGPSCDHAGHTALWDTSRTLKYQLPINFGKTQVSALLDFGQNENIFNFGD